VVVLGSGAAGLAAALTAATAGATVTVLEGSALFGGTSAVSGGGMWLPGNTLDPAWTDSLAGAKVYPQRLGMGLVSEAVIDRFLAESGQIPGFFAANSPLTFTADHPSYVIGDKHCLARLRAGGPALGPDQGDGWAEADTLREVADKLGIDADGLSEQVRSYNEHAGDGTDPVFHRGEKPWEIHYLPGHRTIGPITEGPFVGYRVRAGVFGTRGGPVINENAQITDFGNQPIPGLYGAGNVVAHPFASAYPGGGGTLGPAVTFGHVAGKSVLSDNGGAA